MDQLPLFQEDSRVSHSAQPGSEEAQMMTATSGRSCYASWKSYSRPGWLAKTFLDFFLSTAVWKSTVCLLRWKLQTTNRGYCIIRLRALVPTTSGTEFSLWRTPETSQGGTVSEESLQEMAQGNWKRESGQTKQLRLQDQVRHPAMWPTAQARDYRSGDDPNGKRAQRKREQGWTINLNDAVKMWPTPKSRDWKDGASEGTQDRHSPDLGKVVGQSPQTGALNPTWVEWLMGFPPGWTENPTSQELQPESKTGPRD